MKNAPVKTVLPSYPGIELEFGSAGNDVKSLQVFLNRISRNYPAIPKIPAADGIFVFVCFAVAGNAALEQAVIALCVEQSLFVKAGLLETVIDVRGDDEIVPVLHEFQQLFVHRLRRVGVPVDENELRPVRPHFLRCFIRVKPA